MSENDMADLRREVARRLNEALGGKTVDMMEGVKPRLPHMIGATPLDEVVDPEHFSDTLIDPSHDFWDDYYEDISTEGKATEELITAIESLREQDLFRMIRPYGEEAGIIYCEVDDPDQYEIVPNPTSIETVCKSCGESTTTRPNLVLTNGHYHLTFTIDCEHCDFTSTFERNLIRA